MDPALWGRLPPDLLEHIANFADIDTRRAMGFKPRRLDVIDFDPRPMPPVEYRYYINEKKLWYFEMYEYLGFYFEVQTGIELVDPAVPLFRETPGAQKRGVMFSEHQTRILDFRPETEGHEFQTAGWPVWMA